MTHDLEGRRPVQLDLRHLRLVSAVAESGGQTRAARRLNLTQSALSHQLRELEARIGAPLFIRASRHMVLTAIGERMLASARRVLHEVETLERDLMTAHADGGAGVVRLATECYTCYHWLPAVVTAFRDEWPQVDVRIVAEATADPVRALLDGALDLAIVAGDVDERRLGCTSLFEDEQVVVVAPNHPFANREFVGPEDLRHEHLILYTTHSSESTVLREVLRPAGVEPRHLTRVQLTEAIVELVKAGLGISVLARWAIAPQLRDGSLVGVPLTARGFHRRWWAVTRPHESAPAYQQRLLELLGHHLQGGPQAVRLGKSNGVRAVCSALITPTLTSSPAAVSTRSRARPFTHVLAHHATAGAGIPAGLPRCQLRHGPTALRPRWPTHSLRRQ